MLLLGCERFRKTPKIAWIYRRYNYFNVYFQRYCFTRNHKIGTTKFQHQSQKQVISCVVFVIVKLFIFFYFFFLPKKNNQPKAQKAIEINNEMIKLNKEGNMSKVMNCVMESKNSIVSAKLNDMFYTHVKSIPYFHSVCETVLEKHMEIHNNNMKQLNYNLYTNNNNNDNIYENMTFDKKIVTTILRIHKKHSILPSKKILELSMHKLCSLSRYNLMLLQTTMPHIQKLNFIRTKQNKTHTQNKGIVHTVCLHCLFVLLRFCAKRFLPETLFSFWVYKTAKGRNITIVFYLLSLSF